MRCNRSPAEAAPETSRPRALAIDPLELKPSYQWQRQQGRAAEVQGEK